jgi:rhodanese-related sulfurtransferase
MTVNTIAPGELYDLLESNARLSFIDVRTPAEYAQVHAAGATLSPLDELDAAAIAARSRESGETIYVICKSGGRSAKACEYLTKAGAPSVFSVEGGTDAWEKAGLPVERGSVTVISLERQVRIGAGGLVLIGAILGWTVNRGFIAIPAFVGGGLLFAGITDTCGMAMVLARMPWNRSSGSGTNQSGSRPGK